MERNVILDVFEKFIFWPGGPDPAWPPFGPSGDGQAQSEKSAAAAKASAAAMLAAAEATAQGGLCYL